MNTFTYANVRIDNDPSNLWTIDLDLTLDGDTYQVTVEWNEDPDMERGITVTLDDVDQYWDMIHSPFPVGVEKPTHFSRTFDSDDLYNWVLDTFLTPVWEAQRQAVRAMQGAAGTVNWVTP